MSVNLVASANFLPPAPLAYLLVAYLPVAYLPVAYLLVALLGGVPPGSHILRDSLFGGSGPMAASHQALLSPSTYIGLGVSLFGCDPLKAAMVTSLYLHFAHTCSLPALLSIGTYPPLSTS